MSFINKLPVTNFTLPGGEQIQTRNILKTLLISNESKNNNSIIKIKNGTSVSKLENLSYNLYGDKRPLYWLTTHLNDIDSFSKTPIPASKFESNLQNKYPGKCYYVSEAKMIYGILSGDYFVLYTDTSDEPDPDTWKVAGKIKEFDGTFRRIIIEREIENTENSNPLPINSKIFVFRENQEPVTAAEYVVGKTENEYEKINYIYDTGLNGIEINPYRKVDVDGNLLDDYDFSDSPSTDTILYKLASNLNIPIEISNLYYDTLEKEEIRNNTKNNSIKYLENDLAYEATAYINSLFASTFKRGQKIIIEE